MLSKIFSFGNRKAVKKHVDVEIETNEIHGTKRPFPQLEQDEIRVLVFRDCDRKGKTLLFDSKAITKDGNLQDGCHHKGNDAEQKRLSGGPKMDPKQGNKSPTQKPKLQHSRPSQDATMLGEMIFGSVAMTYKGQTVKVHEIRMPHQLLLTNVFAVKPRIVLPNCCDGNDDLSTSSQADSLLDDSSRIDTECGSLSSQNSFSSKETTGLIGISSKPVDVPGSSPVLVIDADADSVLTTSVDSSYMDEALPSNIVSSTSSPCGSYHRRLYRSHATSIDRNFGRKSEELSEDVSPLMRRRPKLGVGILLSLGDNEEKSRALQGFFFAHFPLFESHVKRLRLAIENACFLKTKLFASHVVEAVAAFRESIHNLLAAPRLKEPVWLNMMTQPLNRTQLCEKFMVQLIDCLRLGNTKETNFFMASVLTAVLQYHLAWVPTVMPAGAAPARAFLDKHSSKTLDLLAQSHPYNPLWAQLGDLYGAVGFPLRVARTVVVGKDSKVVEQVVNILSYFIRCTEVVEHVQRRDDENKGHFQESISNIGDESTCSNCGNKPLVDSENSVKTSCLTSETDVCVQCKQNCGGNCSQQCELKEKQDKEFLCEEILNRFHNNGIVHCPKCRLLSNSALGKLCDDKILQSHCTCIGISSGGIQKELKHFMKDRNHSSRSFRCYCCHELKDNNHFLSKGKTYDHTCDLQGDSGKHQGQHDSKKNHCISCLCKCRMPENGNSDCQNPSNDCLTRLITSVQSKDTLKNLNGHLDGCISETDSCIFDSLDTASVRSSVFDKGKDVEESAASHGRSGSADSGIYQSPLNSPSAQQSSTFSTVTAHLGEDSQIPKELSFPDVMDVSCSLDPNSKLDEWRTFNHFGRSLFAGICGTYLPDFVLQGVPDNDFKESLSADLKLALQHSVVDDPVSEAVCILANTDKWTCKLVSVKKHRKNPSSDPVHVHKVEASSLVLSMLSSLRGLWDLKMSAEFCLMHLEDKLKEIYLKSKVLTGVRDRKALSELTKMLSVDDSDVPLLLSVAGTHTPHNVSLRS